MLEEVYDAIEIAIILVCMCSDKVLLGKANAEFTFTQSKS